MNIAYLIWLEDLEGPILQGQVIEILKQIAKKLRPSDNIYLIYFQLAFFRPYSKIFNRLKQFQDKKRELNKLGINLITVPVLGLPSMLPSRLFSAQWYILPLVFIQTFIPLIVLSLYLKIDILHCRSYPPTVGAVFIRMLFRRLRLVFDPRSDFPGENVTAGRWKKNSLSLRVWKSLEKLFIDKSDITIYISKSFLDHYQNISRRSNFVKTPNNVDVTRFKRDNSFRKNFRDKYNIGTNEIIFCYSGSMGALYWHNPELYASYIIQLRKLKINHRFLFIIPSFESLYKAFKIHSIESYEYILVKSDFNDVHKYLSTADVGMILMGKKDIRMSIKTVEYLSVGLPVMTNSNVLGARELVEENNAGIIIDSNSDIGPLSEFCENLLLNKDKINKKNRGLACRFFSNNIVSSKYVDVYKNL
jgi:glycosyltransferase involved in cell wall biosynthesis